MKNVVVRALASAGLASAFDLVINPRYAQNSPPIASAPLDLSELRNSRGFASGVGDADLDGLGGAYPAEFLPSSDLVYGGVEYAFPEYQSGGGNDNVLAEGQVLSVPRGRYASVEMLAAAEAESAAGNLGFTYADNTTSTSAVLVPPFWQWVYPFGGDIILPYRFTNASIDFNRSMIYQSSHFIDSTRELTSVTLPGSADESDESQLHIFALSLVAAEGKQAQLEVVFARSTQTWVEGTNKTQIFEATVANTGTEWILAAHKVEVTVEAEGVKTVLPGKIHRLRPGDRAQVQVGVTNDDSCAEGTKASATLHVSGHGISATRDFDAVLGIAPYDATYESVYSHEASPWFTTGKYGIFIHWGVYSVPGWGNSGDNEDYAEWYWWWLGQGSRSKTNTTGYHLETYGPGFEYDDFIPDFTADAYDPKEWVDLIADAGAQYFVLTSKHHDGYALFDLPADVSQRTSVALPPHRDLLQELFDAAAAHQPHLHRATYFTLPEWFHPDYAAYGFDRWPGGNFTNPYTDETQPYAGHVRVDDFLTDLIAPEMRALAEAGTEILWCDIGGPNVTAEVAAWYFNYKAAQGKQVLINNRCGLPGDFDTPEYARYESVQAPRKWESSLGMDPYSYGYNMATADDEYMVPEEIVTQLMDIVSKNGNFLLDIGPMANGTILEIEKTNLREAGKWIHSHAEAIFNTTYWYVAPQQGDEIRFTQTPEAFYITALAKPNSTLTLTEPVPYVDGDQVTVVGGDKHGEVVPSKLLEGGELELAISDQIQEADEFAWVFKIDFLSGRSC